MSALSCYVLVHSSYIYIKVIVTISCVRESFIFFHSVEDCRHSILSRTEVCLHAVILIRGSPTLLSATGNRIWTGGRDYRNTLYLPGNELSIDSDAAVIFLVLVIALQVCYVVKRRWLPSVGLL